MNFIELEIEAPLSNVRVQKEEVVFVGTKTTKGTMVLSKLAMTALGVTLGDLVNVVKAKNGKIYISKGYQDEKVKVGSKLTGQLGRDLSFSSASVYEALGGNENTNRIFDILELENPEYNVAISLPNGEQVKAYPIEFKAETAKQKRAASKTSKEVATSAPANAEMEDLEDDVQVEETSTDMDWDNQL
jgi:hypothetical protein